MEIIHGTCISCDGQGYKTLSWKKTYAYDRADMVQGDDSFNRYALEWCDTCGGTGKQRDKPVIIR